MHSTHILFALAGLAVVAALAIMAIFKRRPRKPPEEIFEPGYFRKRRLDIER